MEGIILRKKRVFLEKIAKSSFFTLLPREVQCILEYRSDHTRKLRPTKKKIDSIMWKIDFSHKLLDDLNNQSIFFMKEVNKSLPSQVQNKSITRPVFSYGRTIGLKILNYYLGGKNLPTCHKNIFIVVKMNTNQLQIHKSLV